MGPECKLVVMGDGAVGKTSLICSYARDQFSTDYFIPTVYDPYSVAVPVMNQPPIQLTVHDTAGQKDFDRTRPLAYPSTDIFLVCFAVDSPTSLENVREVWVPEIHHYCPSTPFILVGLKSDLRTVAKSTSAAERKRKERREGEEGHVSHKMGHEMARQLGAAGYMECSAHAMHGIKEVFEEAVIEVAVRRPKKRPRCRCASRRRMILRFMCIPCFALLQKINK